MDNAFDVDATSVAVTADGAGITQKNKRAPHDRCFCVHHHTTTQAAGSVAFSVFAVPPRRRSDGDGGVVISDAAAQRRRSLMGTGLNIGGGVMSDSDDSDDSDDGDDSDDSSNGFEDSGSFHVRFSRLWFRPRKIVAQIVQDVHT